MDDDLNMHASVVQAVREERLAALLKAYLRRWTEGDSHGFQVWACHLPCKVKQAPFFILALVVTMNVVGPVCVQRIVLSLEITRHS